MNIVTIIICIGLLFLSRRALNGLKRTFMTTYIMIWLILLILSSFSLYGLYDVSNRVMTYILLSILMFSIGFYSKVKFILGSKKKYYVNDFKVDRLIDNRYFKGLLLFTSIPMFIYAYRFLECYSTLGPGQARMAVYTIGPVFHSYLELEIYNYIVFPYFLIITSIFIYAFFLGKLKLISAILIGINIVLYILIGFGRIGLIQAFCCVFITYYFTKKQTNKIDRIKKPINYGIIVVSCMLVLVFVVIITAKRYNIQTITWKNIEEIGNILFEQVYVYVVGAFRSFDYQLENLKIQRFGRLTFNAIDELIVMILNVIGFNADYSSSGILQESVPIGIGQNMNAFYTSLFHFYYDFRVLGIIVFSYLFGIIVNQIIRRVNERKTLPSLILASYFFYAMIMMPIKWEMSSPGVLILIIICLFWDRRKMSRISE